MDQGTMGKILVHVQDVKQIGFGKENCSDRDDVLFVGGFGWLEGGVCFFVGGLTGFAFEKARDGSFLHGAALGCWRRRRRCDRDSRDWGWLWLCESAGRRRHGGSREWGRSRLGLCKS